MSATSSSDGAARPGVAVDVYLMPAVIGGGLGDIDEVLVAGAHLARTGAPLFLFRAPGRPLPRGVDGPWDWPSVTAVRRPARRHPRALTVTPCFGVSAAPPRDAAFGRPGPWAVEAEAIDRAYGTDATVHVSLEEFARTYTAERENRERYREGGTPPAESRRRAGGRQGARDVARWRAAFRRFRALDDPRVLHLLATFQPDARFARQFPEVVQTGPLWPPPSRRSVRRADRGAVYGVVWYASPGSSARIAPAVAAGLAGLGRPAELTIRSARPVLVEAPAGLHVRELPAMSPAGWRRLWDAADLRIATGSRTLLEALAHGGPFLYFNGITGSGRSARRHRPEKIAALLRLFRSLHVPPGIGRDLDRFSRGQRVAEVVRRATSDPTWARGWPPPGAVRASGPRDAGAVLRQVVREWGRFHGRSADLVRRIRGRPVPSGRPRSARS